MNWMSELMGWSLVVIVLALGFAVFMPLAKSYRWIRAWKSTDLKVNFVRSLLMLPSFGVIIVLFVFFIQGLSDPGSMSMNMLPVSLMLFSPLGFLYYGVVFVLYRKWVNLKV